MSTPRPWSAGASALCRHSPRCANIWQTETEGDVTFPCSGLSMEDAALIVAAVNAIGPGSADLDSVLRAVEAEWRRVHQLMRDAAKAQDRKEGT